MEEALRCFQPPPESKMGQGELPLCLLTLPSTG